MWRRRPPEEKHLEMENGSKGLVLAPLQEILSALAVEEAHSFRAMLSVFLISSLFFLVFRSSGAKPRGG